MSFQEFKRFLRYISSKDSKPLILFVRLSGAGLFFLASIFITNYYDIAIVSDFEFANSLLLLTGSLVLFGTDISILQISGKLSSEHRMPEIRAIVLKAITLIFLLSAIVLFAFFVLTLASIPELLDIQKYSPIIYKVLACIGFYATSVFCAESLRPIKGNLITELYNGVFKYILLFIGVFVLYTNGKFNLLIDLYLLSFVVIAIVTFIHFMIASSELKSPTTYSYKDIIKISFPMSISSLSFFLLLTTDVILLKFLGANDAVSIYAQPLKIIAIIIRIKVTLEASVSKDLATYYFAQNFVALREKVKSINRWVALFCLPLLIIFVLFARETLTVFGPQYVLGLYAFYILLASVFLNVVSGCTGNYMNMTGKQVALQNILLSTAVINILLNILLIPLYGIVGASIASFTAVFYWNLLALIYIWKKDRVLLILS